jgi:hypothetical protein
MRRHSDVRIELFADAAGALSAADEWRRAIELSEERLVEDEFEAWRSNHWSQSSRKTSLSLRPP